MGRPTALGQSQGELVSMEVTPGVFAWTRRTRRAKSSEVVFSSVDPSGTPGTDKKLYRNLATGIGYHASEGQWLQDGWEKRVEINTIVPHGLAVGVLDRPEPVGQLAISSGYITASLGGTNNQGLIQVVGIANEATSGTGLLVWPIEVLPQLGPQRVASALVPRENYWLQSDGTVSEQDPQFLPEGITPNQAHVNLVRLWRSHETDANLLNFGYEWIRDAASPTDVTGHQNVSVADGGAIALDYAAGNYVTLQGQASSGLVIGLPVNMPIGKFMHLRFDSVQISQVTWPQGDGQYRPKLSPPTFPRPGQLVEIQRWPDEYALTTMPDDGSWPTP